MLKFFLIEMCKNITKFMFHSLILLKNVQIFKGMQNVKLFYIKRVGIWPLFNVQKSNVDLLPNMFSYHIYIHAF